MSKDENVKKTTKSTTKSKKTTTKSKKTTTRVKKETNKVKKESVKKKIDTEEITLEEAESVYHVSLLAQTICVVGVLAISILAIFEHSFTIPIEVLVGITLLFMAYNNYKLFKRKNLTIVYIIFGIISFITGIVGYFGLNGWDCLFK